ncbi:uncharacterized protein [Pocillopora verrucosa]|uniref:uncharacterized protein isoform X2 n=1 Tax=Pocillopora verrucosa TaxID=203993 RepID=UPI0033424237
MAEGGSGSADISLSMGIVREEVKKDRFKTIGSACIIRYPSSPKKSPLDPKAASVEQKEYVCVLATTSEVVSKADLTSSKKFWVQFSSDKLWCKFSLDNVEFMEMRPSNEASSLTLFPIKSSLKQTQSSRLILGDDWTPNRSQPCYQAQSKTEVKDTKNELICYVLAEDVSTGKFRPACYFLSVDERGSYYLHPHGNKAIMKKLGDFQSTEKPKGSVILNEDKYVVGFLAFGDTNEIHPFFLPDYLQDNNVPRQALSTEATRNPGDHNQNKTDENLMLEVTIRNMHLEQMVGNQNEPQEMSYTSYNRDLLQSSSSEHLTPRARRRLSNSQSVLEPIPLDEVTDPTPFEHKPTLQERHSNSQHGMDRTVTMQTGEVSTKMKHVNAGSYVEELILRKELIMDLLSLYLDRSIYPKFRGAPSLVQHWEHLADYCGVDAKIKKQCRNSAHLSPSEAMFKHLCQSWESIDVGTLKQNLLEIKRKDVYDELANSQDLLDDDSMNDLCNKHPETLWNICLHLDDNRSVQYWYHLGLKIGIGGEILRSFKGPYEFSPSKAILETIETLKPELSLMEVQMVLLEVEKWLPGICNVLNNLLAADSSSTIQTLLDDLDAVEKLTTLLDLEEKAWMLFGSKLGMKRQELNSLREESPPSPTKLLMKHIVAREPELTMKFFLGALANIKRFDVIKELKKFFVAKDIDDLLKG